MSEGNAKDAPYKDPRYGDTRKIPPIRWLIIGLVIALVGGLTYTLVQYSRVAEPNISASAAGWDRGEGDREEDIFIFTLDVTREDPSQEAYCILIAMAYDYGEVGRRDVVIPPSDEQTVRIDVPVQTRDTAVAGDVYGCSTEVPEMLSTGSQS